MFRSLCCLFASVACVENINYLYRKIQLLNLLQEAKQALDLMGRWETIDVTDALELLSPVFEREEVSSYP